MSNRGLVWPITPVSLFALGVLSSLIFSACSSPTATTATSQQQQPSLSQGKLPQLVVETQGPGKDEKVTRNAPFDVFIRVTNPTLLEANEVIVTADIPTTSDLVDSDPRASLQFPIARWTVGRLGGGEVRVFKLVLNSTTTKEQIVKGKVDFAWLDTVPFQIEYGTGAPELRQTFFEEEGNILVGKEYNYLLTLTPVGDAEVRDVRVEFVLPRYVNALSVLSTYPMECSVAAKSVTCPLIDRITLTGSVKITLHVKAVEAGDAVVTALIGYASFSEKITVQDGTLILPQ